MSRMDISIRLISVWGEKVSSFRAGFVKKPLALLEKICYHI